MVKADSAFILFHFVERAVDAIVLRARLVLRQVHAGQRAGHHCLVFFSGNFSLYFVLRLMMSVNDAIDTLTLTRSLLLVNFVRRWLLVSGLANVCRLLS